jgi:hypothetical protein
MFFPLRSVFKNQTVSVSSYHRKLSDEIRDFPAFMCLLKKSGKEASSPDFYPQTISKYIDQRIGLFRGRCPVGGKTDHCIGFIVFFPEAVFDLLPQLLEFFILNNFAYPAVGACYGCSGDELKELCEQYKARAIVNPIHAQKSAKLASDMISVLGDSLEAFLVSDCESGLNSSMMPLMGCLDYLSIKQALEKAPEDSCIVLMMDGYVQHFEKFPDNEKVLTALGGYLAGVVDLLAGKI